jgi:hypothetical protein
MQVVNAMNPFYAEGNSGEREEIVREFKLLSATYSSARA